MKTLYKEDKKERKKEKQIIQRKPEDTCHERNIKRANKTPNAKGNATLI